MRVIGIDPGYDRCGVAILEKTNGKEVVIFSECIETNKLDTLPTRIHAVATRVHTLIREYAPESMAIERLYFTKNQRTAMAVAEARGAIQAVAAECGVLVTEYTPGQVKLAVTGSGAADKKQMIFMIRTLVRLPHTPKRDDEYDAIGVGITHLVCTR